MVTVMDLCNPSHKQNYTCSPQEAVIAAYAQSKNDWNTWQYDERYSHLVLEGKLCISCGDFSAFKDGRNF